MISTGSPRLDTLTGGLLPGRITTFAGEEGVGKSLIARYIAEKVRPVLYMDAACTFSGQALGIMVCRETALSTATDVIVGALGMVDLVVVDTVHAMDCAPDLPLGFDPSRAMQRAWRDALRTIGVAVAKSRAAVLLLAQIYPHIWALHDRSSTYVTLTKGPPINFGVERIGHWINAELCGRETRIPLYYDRGFDPVKEGRLKK